MSAMTTGAPLAAPLLARPADPGAAAPDRLPASTCWPAPGSTRWRCGCRPIRRRWRCCAPGGRPVAAPSANRSGAVSPTPAAHVLDGLWAASPRCWMAAPARSASRARCWTSERQPVPAATGWGAGRGDRGSDRPRRLRLPRGRHSEPNAALAGDDAVALRARCRCGWGPSGSARTRPHSSSARRCRAPLCYLSRAGPERGRGAAVRRAALAGCRRGAAGCEPIAVMPVPHAALGAAINDRLERAAAPRSVTDQADGA